MLILVTLTLGDLRIKLKLEDGIKNFILLRSSIEGSTHEPNSVQNLSLPATPGPQLGPYLWIRAKSSQSIFPSLLQSFPNLR